MKRLSRPTVRVDRDHVLYVEDEFANWQVANLRLQSSYVLSWAKSDEEACELLRKQEFYAILLDVQLRGSTLDGLQLAQVIRGRPLSEPLPEYAKDLPDRIRDVPIIFVTAFGNTLPEEELRGIGEEPIIGKPVNFTQLALALVDAHLRWLRNRPSVPPPSGSAPPNSESA